MELAPPRVTGKPTLQDPEILEGQQDMKFQRHKKTLHDHLRDFE